MKNCIGIALLVFISGAILRAQELDATVRVIAPNLGLSDKSIVTQLEKNIKDFLNSQKWTQDVFEPNERIKCNFQVAISADRGENNLSIDLSIQATRPVFNSTYETPLLNIHDKGIPIQFDPYKNLENSKETYYDNLSSVLTFYAYLILALDYDSFSLEGGESYLQLLNNMINSLPSNVRSGDDAWSPAKDKRNNRYFIIENLTNPRMKLFRRAYYEYHRLAMDNMSKDPAGSRSNLSGIMSDIGRANASYPDTYLMKIFGFTKQKEIIEIFKQGTVQEKQNIKDVMSKIDPANSNQYNSYFKS